MSDLSEKIERLQLSSTTTKNDIETLVTDLTEILIEPAQQVGLCKKIRSKKKGNPRKSPNQSWFNSSAKTNAKNFLNQKTQCGKQKQQLKKTTAKSKWTRKALNTDSLFLQTKKSIHQDFA